MQVISQIFRSYLEILSKLVWLGGRGQFPMPPNVPAPLKLHRILQVCILRQVKLSNPFAKPDGMFEMSFQNNLGPSRIENEGRRGVEFAKRYRLDS